MPDPDFLFLSKSHKRALSYLDYGIRERAGFILLTGEVGSGKTTIIRDVIKKRLDNLVLSKIFNTKVDSEQLLAMVCDDFGIPEKNRDKVSLLRGLNDFLIEQFVKGTRPVLIVDEAQNLDPQLLEEIRMLSNLEADNAKLLQIILVGQPELRETLSSPAMVQLRQRISINCHLRALSRAETEEYILHRLHKAGNRNAATFPAESVDIIFTYSKGIPRLINIICDFLLLSAFADQTKIIDPGMVKEIISDLDFDRYFWGKNEISRHATTGKAATAPPAETASGETEIYSMLKDMSQRLDRLGEPGSVRPELYRDMAEKISQVEQCVQSYRTETLALISELGKNLPMDHDFRDHESRTEKGGNRKAGFFKRLAGNFDFR